MRYGMLVLLLCAAPCRAQLAGAALGLSSGVVLGTAAGLIPCSRTDAGPRCVRTAAALGAAVGLAGGLYLGGRNEGAVEAAARRAGYGLLVGATAGVVVKELVRPSGWVDVAAGAVVGAGVGATAPGSGIGLAAGAVVGIVLDQVLPSFELPDAIAVAMLGMAVGGLSQWYVQGIDAEGTAPSLAISIHLTH